MSSLKFQIDAALAHRIFDERFGGIANFAEEWADSGKSGTVRVGSYASNAFGLYDTIGNVREWVEDCQQTAYSGIPADGSANIDSLGCEDRRTRGGAWQDLDLFVQSRGGRGSGLPSRRNNLTGFRIARAL